MVPLFVSIFGPDGSGKSTQAGILANYLLSRGLKVKLAWIKSYHTFAYVLSEIIERLSSRSVILNAQGSVIRINSVSNGSINRSVWAWIELVSVLPLVIFHVYLPLYMGWVVIADRYLVDSIVSIAYTLNDLEFDSSLISKALLCLFPKNSILVHLDSNYTEIKKRRGAMTDPEDFLQFQRIMYDKISKRLKVVRIDTGQQNVEETAKIIRGLLPREVKYD